MQQKHFKSLQTFKGQLVGVQDWPDAVCAGQKPSASPLRSYSEAHCSEFLSSLAVLPATVSFRMFDKPNRFHHAFRVFHTIHQGAESIQAPLDATILILFHN